MIRAVRRASRCASASRCISSDSSATSAACNATSLPAAPWQMAGVLKVPLIAAFGLFRGGKRYEIHFERLEVPQQFERRDRARNVANMAQRFADRLAHYAGIAPYNWFNFYEFWPDENKSSRADRLDAASSDAQRTAVDRR
jgi:predicted LPLAT superfamily acyltransferase